MITLDVTNGITTPDLESAGPVTANGVTTSLYPLVSGTAVASTSGTSIDFTGIPSWVKRITLMFQGVSISGSSNIMVKLGTSGGIVSTGYLSAGSVIGATVTTLSSTAGFVTYTSGDSDTVSGQMSIMNITGNAWVSSHTAKSSSTTTQVGGGDVTLSGTLDRIRITTTGGANTFDAGSINILYE